MNKFITEIIVKMKPNKPQRKSDVEILDELISDKFITLHKALLKQGVKIMAELKDVQDAIAAEKAEVAAKLAELATVIESLEAELANGTPVTGDDLAALVAQVQGIYAEPVLTPVEPLPAE